MHEGAWGLLASYILNDQQLSPRESVGACICKGIIKPSTPPPLPPQDLISLPKVIRLLYACAPVSIGPCSLLDLTKVLFQ